MAKNSGLESCVESTLWSKGLWQSQDLLPGYNLVMHFINTAKVKDKLTSLTPLEIAKYFIRTSAPYLKAAALSSYCGLIAGVVYGLYDKI